MATHASNKPDEDGSDNRDGDKGNYLVLSGDDSLPEKKMSSLGAHQPGKRGKEFNTPSVMHFPESLVLNETDTAAPTSDEIIDATKKAVDHPDVQTVFFVGFPPSKLEAASSEQLKEVMGMVQSWQAWSSSACEGNVQQKIDNKELPAEPDGQFARSTYRAKVFDHLIRQSTWFAKAFDQNITKHIEAKKVDFHTAILGAILEGFSVPETAYTELEKILTTIGGNISSSMTKTQESQQYWLMLTRYDWQSETQIARPVVQVISFSIDQKMSEYTAGKSKYTSISIDMQFSQYQANFITELWKPIQNKIDSNLISAGMDLVTQKATTIPI